MSRKPKPTTVLLCVLVLMLIGCGVCHAVLSSNDRKQQAAIGVYLEVYKERAIAYLRQDEAFVATYGDACEMSVTSWSYAYTDPGKYPSFSFKVAYPPTLEDFERELQHIQVGFILPDGRTCTVSFEKDPENALKLTGWDYADEEN